MPLTKSRIRKVNRRKKRPRNKGIASGWMQKRREEGRGVVEILDKKKEGSDKRKWQCVKAESNNPRSYAAQDTW